MIEQDFVIKNKLGLHARPAAILVQKISQFKSSIKIIKDNEQIDAKSVMGILALAIAYGETIKFLVDGEDEEAAMTAIKDLIDNNFYIEND